MTKKLLPLLLGFTLLFAVIFSVCFWQSSVVKGAEPEFYAVFNTATEGTPGEAGYKPANTLSFYYDTNKASRTGSKYGPLPTEATKATDWGYNDIRKSVPGVQNVVIDASVANYHGLKSTAYMFYDMQYTNNISGCEYLDVSNVTNMESMFSNYASASGTITAVPNVSNWNTANVTNMEYMFNSYGSGSEAIYAVPDVSNWDTGNVTNMEAMFAWYAENSTAKVQPLYLSGWNINNLTNAAGMFVGYASYKDQGDPVIYATDWSKNTGIDATDMFSGSKIKNANNVTSGQNQLSYANTGATGCFTKAEFYAVFNDITPPYTLTFYYDGYKESRTGTKYGPLPTEATKEADWGYHDNRANIIVVEIDASVANYHGLKSTAFMFSNMSSAGNISGCEYLDVSNVTNMSSMFKQFAKDNQKIEAVPNVSNWNTSNATDMSNMFYGYAFRNVNSIKKVPDVSNWNTSNVTDMSSMFAYYGSTSTSITAVPNVSNWTTSNVADMSAIFQAYAEKSNGITAVPDVSKWNTSNVTNMSYMFSKYAKTSASITAVPDVFNWNTSNVTNMSYMFGEYAAGSTKKLQSLDLSKLNISKLSDASNMFQGYASKNTLGDPIVYAINWSSKTGVTATDMFKDSKLKNAGTGDWTLANNSNGCFTEPEFYAVFNTAKEGDKPANTLSFYYDGSKGKHKALSTVTVYDKIPTEATEETNWGYIKENRTKIENVVIDASVANYHGLKSTAYMFYGMNNANSISGCEYLDTSKVTNMKSMFNSFGLMSSNITAVPNVANWDTSKVEDMSYMFVGYASAFKNNSFTAVPDVSKWNTSSVTNMSVMFKEYAMYSTSITDVPDVSNWDTSKVTDMSSMFAQYAYSSKNCLDDLYLSKWCINSLTKADKMFFNYSAKNPYTNFVHATNWSVKKGVTAFDMFKGSSIKNAPKTSGDQWSLANNRSCFTSYFGTTPITDVKYTGKVINPTLTVYDNGGITLTKDTNYTIEYANNIDAGLANITITGIGSHAGHKEVFYFNIAKRSVTFTSGDATKTYDGTPLTNKDVTTTGDGFVTGEGATFDVTGSQTDAGSSPNTFSYTLNEGTKAGNYDITTVYGTLTVTKRSVTITSASDSKAYDGTPLTNHNVTVSGEDFVQGEGAQYNVTGSQTEVGSSPNTFSYTLNEGTEAGNYDITTVYGTITVNKRKVILTSGSATKEFDRTPLTNDTVYSTGEDGWLGNDGASFNFTGSVTYVSTVKNEFTYTLNQGTKAGNYDIQLVFGDLTITNQKKQDVLMHLDETIASLLEIKDDYDDIIKNGVKILKDFEYEESESYAQNVRRIDKVANEIKKNNSNARLEYCKDEANKLKNDVDQIIEEDNSSWLIKVTKFIGNATRKFFKFSLGNSLSIIQRNVQKFFNVIF